MIGGTLASGRALRRFGRDLRDRPTVREGMANLADARIGYRMATGAGNTSDYALGYAVSQYRPLAQLGTLAAAMGKTSHEFLDGLYTGHRYTHGAGDLLNPHAQRIVHADGMRAIAQRRRASAPAQPAAVDTAATDGSVGWAGVRWVATVGRRHAMTHRVLQRALLGVAALGLLV